jgi:hypothetical protein
VLKIVANKRNSQKLTHPRDFKIAQAMQGFVEEIVGKYNGNVSAVIGLLGSCWDQVHSLQAFWNSLMEQFAGFRVRNLFVCIVVKLNFFICRRWMDMELKSLDLLNVIW